MAFHQLAQCDGCKKKKQVGKDAFDDWIDAQFTPLDVDGKHIPTASIKILYCSASCLRKHFAMKLSEDKK